MDERVDEYIKNKGVDWKHDALYALRNLVLSSDSRLSETIKWGAPTYVAKKNVCSIAAFKNHVALWFFQGAILQDSNNLLHSAQEETKGLRQFHLTENQSIPKDQLKDLIVQAVENDLKGKTVNFEPKKKLEIPSELHDLLSADPLLFDNFQNLPPSKQRDFANHIASAKQTATRDRRLQKAKNLIAQGLGLNDKYLKK